MEMIEGAPFPLPGSTLESLSSDILKRTIINFAKINVQRSKHPLPLVGSLVFDSSTNTPSVGPLRCPFVDDADTLVFGGPWKNAAGKYEDRFNNILGNTQAGLLFADRKEEALLIINWMKGVVMAYRPYNEEGEIFYVVHEDSNGGHIMINEDGGIINGLIDWER